MHIVMHITQELWRLMLIQEDQQETLAALKKLVQKEDINMRKQQIREQFRELVNKQVSGLVSEVYSPQPVYKDQHRPSEGAQEIHKRVRVEDILGNPY